MVRSAVMTCVGRRCKWCMIGVGVSVGENVTLSVRAADMGTHADGYWNVMPEERLCYAHCAFRKTADAAGRTVQSSWALDRARRNIERYFPVVGVLEDLNMTLALLEKHVPLFFRGATALYQKNGGARRMPSS
ncbi:hypothetical protein MTO96_016302 [Rhipicephalus appendiculatus]